MLIYCLKVNKTLYTSIIALKAPNNLLQTVISLKEKDQPVPKLIGLTSLFITISAISDLDTFFIA